jgi:hypothetical protein
MLKSLLNLDDHLFLKIWEILDYYFIECVLFAFGLVPLLLIIHSFIFWSGSRELACPIFTFLLFFLYHYMNILIHLPHLQALIFRL